APLLFTGLETAELTKYAANGFLAMKITFINEMADLCEKLGADVNDVARGIGLDGRIGRKFLHAGPGFGGSCFPKDTLALMRIAEEAGAPSRLIQSVVSVNDARKNAMAGRVAAACGGDVRGLTIAVLGLAFKPETDDMREAPSLPLIDGLVSRGAQIIAFDPAAMEVARPMLPPGVIFAVDATEALTNADALVLITEWNEFRALSPVRMKQLMRGRIILDLRNVFDPVAIRQAGFVYHGIGRALHDAASDPPPDD
ncbi:MAG: nucleotide sugar dehydrogenase, partial [Acidocella sp.]|nr:nucleotide sugar dehydrogenase [Acidocella sp.]